jgi:hypothetical protein
MNQLNDPTSKRKTRSSSSLNTSVGGTVAASMCKSKPDLSRVSVEKCVLDSTEQVCSVLEGLKPSSKLIIESLVWCFIARRSLRENPFSEVEFGRFIKSMRKTALRIVMYQSEDFREQSYVKYWTDTYLAQGFRDSERPVREDWNKSGLFCGWLKRFVSRAVAKRDLSFLYSLQKGSKQMWGPLGDENVRKSIRKSKERLCTFRGDVPEDVCETIKKVSKSIFGLTPNDLRYGSRFMPSGSAVLQASVNNGGALGLFAGLPHTTIGGAGSKEFKFDFEEPRLGLLPSLVHATDAWRQQTFEDSFEVAMMRSSIVDPENPEYIQMYDVRFVHIFEPGKIRNISISDGYIATTLQPLQGLMLDSWKRTEWSTMLHDDLTVKVNLMNEMVLEDCWMSGDYEAATDLLYKQATLSAFEALEVHPLYDLAYMSMTQGRMIYPNEQTLQFWDKAGNFNGEKLEMKEGQLMGHTLSFPLLCVINLSVLRHSLNLWIREAGFENLDEKIDRGRRARLIYKYALVNGDDILFKGPKDLISIFKKVASSVGFKTSQGKNYISLDTCIINSQLFFCVNGRMVRRGYLNLRLVKGNNVKARIAGGEKPVTPSQLGGELSKMVRLCPWTSCSIPTAFSRWKKDFNKSWFQPNWYLPVHLGGYGMDINLAPKEWRVTRAQREVAALFIADPSLALYRSVGSMSLMTKQFVQSLLKPRMIPGAYVPQSFETLITDSKDEWLGRIAYATRAAWSDIIAYWGDELAFLVSKIRKQYRLKPISSEGLELYWNVQYFTVGAPLCPPIGRIRYPEHSTLNLIM